MPVYVIAADLADADPASVLAYLTARGFAADPVNGEFTATPRPDGAWRFICDRNPSNAVQNYGLPVTSDQTQDDQAMQVIRSYVANVQTIASANRTPEQKAISALARIVRNLMLS